VRAMEAALQKHCGAPEAKSSQQHTMAAVLVLQVYVGIILILLRPTKDSVFGYSSITVESMRKREKVE